MLCLPGASYSNNVTLIYLQSTQTATLLHYYDVSSCVKQVWLPCYILVPEFHTCNGFFHLSKVAQARMVRSRWVCVMQLNSSSVLSF